MKGRPKAELMLDPEERQVLQRWARKAPGDGRLAQRARVVLQCAAGKDNKSVAEQTGVGEQTVGKWRKRFIAKRLRGLVDEPRSGAPSTIAISDVEHTVVTTLEGDAPDGGWTTRSLARVVGLSQSTVSRIWRAFGIRSRSAAEPAFADEIADVLGVFIRGSERAILVVAGRPGEAAPEGSRLDKLRRNGPLATTAAAAAGRAATELGEFIGSLTSFCPAGQDVYLVLSGCGRHAGLLWHWQQQDLHHHLHFISTPGGWTALVDRWFARLTGAPLGRGTDADTSPVPTFARYLTRGETTVRPLQRNQKPPDSR